MIRAIIGLFALAAACTALPTACPAASHPAWEYYKTRFIQEDGRVIDFANKQISHSEGQGFTMFLALSERDQPLFHKLWSWTRHNLMIPEAQGLAAWSWGRREDGSWGVLDANNASDGDIFLAWTLARAAQTWNKPEYMEAARSIAAAIRARATREESGRLVLLPGREGFVKPGEVVFNPSYFIFPAFFDLAATGEDAFWRRLHASSRELLAMSLAGPLKLPPDWVRLSAGVVSPWGERGAFFSYDAIRVPLYLAWDNDRTSLAGFAPLLQLFNAGGSIPARIALVAGQTNQGQAPAGFLAVMARAAETLGDHKTAAPLWEQAEARLAHEKDDYYSHVLFLMARTRGLR